MLKQDFSLIGGFLFHAIDGSEQFSPGFSMMGIESEYPEYLEPLPAKG